MTGPSPPGPPTLLTTGYEEHATPESLVRRLLAAGVEALVDVREAPWSRRRGFSKRALADALRAAGIAYRHERALGNPKPARDVWRGGDRERGERIYRERLASAAGAAALESLAAALAPERTCILCVEADPRECHRAIVAAELGRRVAGLRVEHL